MTLYLDYNATAPMPAFVRDAVADSLTSGGNPSSIHKAGRRARALVEEAREGVACLVQAKPANVIFTGGGTEANALALSQAAQWGCVRVLVSAVEHPSILEAATPLPMERLPVDEEGRLDLNGLTAAVNNAGGPVLLSLMAVNNETGVCQPVAEATAIVREYDGFTHCDAVQQVGRMPLSMSETGVDMISVSAHKMGGPAGVGALVLGDSGHDITPILYGGGQERGRRAGTENLPGIAGFGAAVELAHSRFEVFASLKALRDELEARLAPYQAIIFGEKSERFPNTSCFALPAMTAQTLVMALDLEGIAVSAGAACSSGVVARSHVLEAMGAAPGMAAGAIRVSLGWETSKADINRFINALESIVCRISGRSRMSIAVRDTFQPALSMEA
ncbi:MAG: cysteine desulfurase family protein [Parvularculales bacterium]